MLVVIRLTRSVLGMLGLVAVLGSPAPGSSAEEVFPGAAKRHFGSFTLILHIFIKF